MARVTGPTANGSTSTGTGIFDPRRSTSFDSSTTTVKSSASAAMTFSRVWAARRP
jgi:hypothetical protein